MGLVEFRTGWVHTQMGNSENCGENSGRGAKTTGDSSIYYERLTNLVLRSAYSWGSRGFGEAYNGPGNGYVMLGR